MNWKDTSCILNSVKGIVLIMNYSLKIDHISKKIKNHDILKNISFEIPKGSIFSFLGPNGAGKSTLINILVKLLKPTSGKVVLENNHKNNKHYQQVGIVFQENTLDDDLTVYDNLMIRGSLYKMDKNRLKNNITKIIETLHMKEFVYKKYRACSGGQKRIAMIARAIIIEPSVLILDEPTTALDSNIRKTIWDTILELNRKTNTTIFFSSHYLEEAYFSNYICILDKGKILFEGKTQNLVHQNGIKKLIIKENNHSYEKVVSSIKSGLDYINSRDISNITSISLKEPSLEEVFFNMTER